MRNAESARSLRQALVDYVRAVHAAYVGAAGEAVGELPLAREPFTVAIVAAAQMHVTATVDPLPPLAAHERPVDDELGPLRWQVRFLDATVLPALAAPGEAGVRELLGVQTVLYDLEVRSSASLDAHQAMHAGTGLANAHLSAR